MVVSSMAVVCLAGSSTLISTMGATLTTLKAALMASHRVYLAKSGT